MLTSEYLAGFLKDTDEGFHEDVPDADRDFDPRDFAERFVGWLMGSVLSFSNPVAAQVTTIAKTELLQDWFDDYLVRLLLKEAPKMAGRAAQLSPIVTTERPRPKTERYLKEATRAYVFGFWASCIVLCRAALEQALKDRLKKRDTEEAKMSDLIKEALWSGVIDQAHEAMASKVQLEGNNWMHGRTASNSEAVGWETLCAARGVLEYVFAGNEQ